MKFLGKREILVLLNRLSIAKFLTQLNFSAKREINGSSQIFRSDLTGGMDAEFWKFQDKNMSKKM